MFANTVAQAHVDPQTSSVRAPARHKCRTPHATDTHTTKHTVLLGLHLLGLALAHWLLKVQAAPAEMSTGGCAGLHCYRHELRRMWEYQYQMVVDSHTGVVTELWLLAVNNCTATNMTRCSEPGRAICMTEFDEVDGGPMAVRCRRKTCGRPRRTVARGDSILTQCGPAGLDANICWGNDDAGRSFESDSESDSSSWPLAPSPSWAFPPLLT